MPHLVKETKYGCGKEEGITIKIRWTNGRHTAYISNDITRPLTK